MAPGAAQAVAQAAWALRESAKDHKRASVYHKRAARRCMENMGQLARVCAELGIKLEIQGVEP